MTAATCPKCGSTEIVTTYHKQGCHVPGHDCSECSYYSNSKRHDEHLHDHCRGCHFDWTRDVLNAAA